MAFQRQRLAKKLITISYFRLASMSSTTITTTPKRKAFRKLKWSSRKKAKTVYSRPRTMQMSRMIVPVGRGPVPQQTIVTLKFNHAWVNTDTTYDLMFNLNSILEPLRGSTAHQPLGRDQYSTFYNRYRVLKVKATLVAGTVSTYSGGPLQIVLVSDNSGTALTVPNTSIEQRGATKHVSGASNYGPVRATRTFYPNVVTGVTKKAYEDDRFEALFSSNPSEVIVLHVCSSDIFGNLHSASSVHYSLLLEYTVSMFDPNPLASS